MKKFIAIKLKELRNEKQLTLKQIASALNIPLTTYANYEQSVSEPNLEILKLICLFYDVSADYLLGLEDETGAKTYINNSFNNFNNKNGNFSIK